MRKLTEICAMYGVTSAEAFKCIKQVGDTEGVKLLGEVNGEIVVSSDFAKMLEDEKTLADELVIKDISPCASIPLLSGPCLYFLCVGGHVVYIGQSLTVVQRIGAHLYTKEFDSVAIVPCDKRELTMAEQINIRYYNPGLNVSKWSNYDFLRELLNRCCISDLRDTE